MHSCGTNKPLASEKAETNIGDPKTDYLKLSNGHRYRQGWHLQRVSVRLSKSWRQPGLKPTFETELGGATRRQERLSCSDFLHSNCFHMARSVNVILELPLVISSPSHQGFSTTTPPPPLILSRGLKNSTWLGGVISQFSHTRRRQWACSLLSLGCVQGTRRNLPEGMFSHTLPTYAFMLCTCEDFSEASVITPPPFVGLFLKFLQPSALMPSRRK